MKSSYKVSLLIATVLCVVVVWYYASQSKPNEATANIKPQPDPTAGIDVESDALPPLTQDPRSAPATGESPAPAAPRPKLVPELRLDGSAPPPRPATTVPPQSYTVQPGDSFTRIAVKLYGDESRWDELAKANPTVDPGKLRVGQVLKLPDQAALDRSVASTDPAAAAPGDTIVYTVKAGDTLSDIAQAYYGDTSRWRYLYTVNKAVIGSNPNTLRAGTKLKIPPAARAAE